MKTLKFLAILCILLGCAVNTAHQAVVIKEDLDPVYELLG
jgi:hypothetical protein